MNDPYSTHLHVLAAFGKRYEIHRIAEFGGGKYSTPLFLDVSFSET